MMLCSSTASCVNFIHSLADGFRSNQQDGKLELLLLFVMIYRISKNKPEKYFLLATVRGEHK